MAGSFEASSSISSHSKPTAIAPSPRMLQAALSGLMAVGVIGCSDSDDNQKADSTKAELSDEELKAACADMVADAKKAATKRPVCLLRCHRSHERRQHQAAGGRRHQRRIALSLTQRPKRHDPLELRKRRPLWLRVHLRR